MTRVFLFLAVCAGWCSSTLAQLPPLPATASPVTKATPQAQAPQYRTYKLVPVDEPAQAVQVQQPQYQTVQLVQQPALQTQTVYQSAASTVCASPAAGISTTVAASSGANRTVVLGPGLVGLSIARVGQFMTGAGKTHVWNISHSTVQPLINPAPPVQTMMTVTQPQPVVQQPTQVQLVSMPQPVQQQMVYQINAPSENAPPPPVIGPPQTPPVVQPPTPSPQAQPVQGHKLFGFLGH
jgi:hypothetical protein